MWGILLRPRARVFFFRAAKFLYYNRRVPIIQFVLISKSPHLDIYVCMRLGML